MSHTAAYGLRPSCHASPNSVHCTQEGGPEISFAIERMLPRKKKLKKITSFEDELITTLHLNTVQILEIS